MADKWYRTTVIVRVKADSPEEASDIIMGKLSGDGLFTESWYPEEMTPEQVQGMLELREILRQADEDCKAGLLVEDPNHPGARFTPAAAAALAALEFEAGEGD